ncbi:MAG: ABC transporter substrate-binding protein [Firmicutes bacterium]|nr:ABC transporter substrate-binding protein [Bacillota bacterium]
MRTKKIVVFCLSLILLLSVGAAAYNESPMLAEQVQKGLLPPVEERLPVEPLVIRPFDEVGVYGGTLRTATTEPNTWSSDGHSHIRIPYLFWLDPETEEIIPYLAKGYEFSEDNRVLTITLREGTKWSDGHPFTADDIMFWWEDVIGNDELTPVKPAMWSPGGELAVFEKIDDYTIRIEFAVPFKPIISYLAYWGSQQGNMFHPKHYVKQWHIKYNPDANELAKEEGLEFWYQSFQNHSNITPGQVDLNLPTLNPWMIVERNPSRIRLEHNPYYLAVDTEGNQLPYIDSIVVDVLEREMLVMRALSGDLDICGRSLEISDISILKESEARGDYRLLLWTSTVPADIGIGFNLCHKDPKLREIYQQAKFRQALSLAINREEINDLVFFGFGVPMQATVHPNNSFFKEEWAKAYAEYDPARANQLLDELGFERGADGFRRTPDGETFTVTINYSSTLAFANSVLELVRDYWEKVGVRTVLSSHERTLYTTMVEAGEVGVGVWMIDRMTESRVSLPDVTKFNPTSEVGWAYAWKQWLNTDGEQGEEPSGPAAEAFMEFMNAFQDWYTVESDAEYQEIAERIWDNQAENLWILGTVGLSQRPIVAANRLHNFPEHMPWGDDMSWWRITYPEQWFIK